MLDNVKNSSALNQANEFMCKLSSHSKINQGHNLGHRRKVWIRNELEHLRR